MNILFIHSNYPAQFQHLARALGRDPRHRVKYLTAREDASSIPIPGVGLNQFATSRPVNDQTHHYLQSAEAMVLNGQAVLRGVIHLLEEGFKPDLAICHGGNGLSLFLKELLPKLVVIGLFEWWFRSETSRWLFQDFPLDTKLKVSMRNMTIQQELLCCDRAVVPTTWQAQQFPTVWQPHLNVIFEGIDTTFFHPAPHGLSRNIALGGTGLARPLTIRAHEKVLSYATRGMEPIRGFPEFMHSLPAALAEEPSLRVLIAGRDEAVYSYPAPSNGGSWKQHCLEELGSFKGKERIHFTGILTYADYRKLLWRSDCHCSFSRPYVLSWSLFEAVACRTPLIISDHAGTREVMPGEDSREWINLDDPAGIAGAIHRTLGNSNIAQTSISANYQLEHCLASWQVLINETLKTQNAVC